jgi:signal peptidase II
MDRVNLRLLWIAVVVVVLDQLSKGAALAYLSADAEVGVIPFLNLTLAYNRGAAFGFLNAAGGWQNLFFIVVAIIACAVILYVLLRPASHDRTVAVGLVLILGGAIGNVIDRVLYGHVVDFIKVYYGSWHWPVFNVADSAITVGAVLLVLDAFGIGFGKRRIAS